MGGQVTTQSQKFTLNQQDIKDWIKGTVRYGAPVLLVFLLDLQANNNIQHALWIVYAYVLQQAVGLLKKYVQ